MCYAYRRFRLIKTVVCSRSSVECRAQRCECSERLYRMAPTLRGSSGRGRISSGERKKRTCSCFFSSPSQSLWAALAACACAAADAGAVLEPSPAAWRMSSVSLLRGRCRAILEWKDKVTDRQHTVARWDGQIQVIFEYTVQKQVNFSMKSCSGDCHYHAMWYYILYCSTVEKNAMW